jgi:hypothetical protein
LHQRDFFLEKVMLDLNEFERPFRQMVPVWKGRFVLCKKKYRVRAEDGWHLVEVKGNEAKAIEPYYGQETIKSLAGFSFNQQFIPASLDVFRRKFGMMQSLAHLRFCCPETFAAIRVVEWDGHFYFLEPDYSSFAIYDVKAKFDAEESLEGMKGLTPELRMVYLFHSLQRKQVQEALAAAEAEAEAERIKNSFPMRLKARFDAAGAVMLNYSLNSRHVVVDWEIPGMPHKYNTVLDRDSFMILEAGYCMSGDDRRHNITSLVKTAQDYEERGLTYVTRG